MNDNEMKMIDTMAKAVGYQLALGAISDEDAYVTAWHYWEKFPMKINSNEFIQLVGYHRAVKELNIFYSFNNFALGLFFMARGAVITHTHKDSHKRTISTHINADMIGLIAI